MRRPDLAEVHSDAPAIDVNRYLRVLWSNAWVVILVIVVAAGGTYVWSTAQPNIYQGSALVRVFDPSDPSVSSGGVHVDPLREVDIQVLYAQSPAVVAEFKQRMGKSDAKVTSTSVSAVTTADAMTVAVSSGNKQVAQAGAATYAQVYLDRQRASLAARYGGQAATLRAQAAGVQSQVNAIDQQIAVLAPTNSSHVVLENGHPIVVPETTALQDLSAQSNSLNSKYADLLTQAAQADVISGDRQADLGIVQSPSLPKTPISPLPPRNAAIAALAGLLVGLGIVVLRYRLFQRVVSTSDLKVAVPEIPYVAAIPPNHPRGRRLRSPTLDLARSTDGRLAESYRSLRAGLRFAHGSQESMILLVTSPRASEGKTTTAANLALSLAQGGEQVLIIDCDLRHPNIHEVFGISNKVGFSSVVVKASAVATSVTKVPVSGGTLDVMPAGPPSHSPAEVLLKPSVATLLAEAKMRYDFIVIDSPPVLPVADAVTLAPSVDGVLLVVRAKKTRSAALRQAVELLEQFDAPLRGAVLVGARHERAYGDYYYYAANASGKHHKRKTKQARRPSRTTVSESLNSGASLKPGGRDSDSPREDKASTARTTEPVVSAEPTSEFRG
jgi:capsular exopolysaccharide synthesis family protein